MITGFSAGECPTRPRPSLTLGAIAGGLIALASGIYQPGVRVVDGDTVDHGFLRWRLAGIDAPEIRRSQCGTELEAGRRARERLKAMIAEARGDWRIEPVTGAGRDPYGRALGRLILAGRDAGEALVAVGLARPYSGGHRAGWCSSGPVAGRP